jgi:hypothetical protein
MDLRCINHRLTDFLLRNSSKNPVISKDGPEMHKSQTYILLRNSSKDPVISKDGPEMHK